MHELGAAALFSPSLPSRVCLRALLLATAQQRDGVHDTPHAVIARLLDLDGDLLVQFSRLLGCGDDLDAALAPIRLPALRRVVGAAIAEHGGRPIGPTSAWLERLACALRAEALARAIGFPEPLRLRRVTLRGLCSGDAGQLPSLAHYRNYRVADLADAPLELRLGVCAVVAPEQRVLYAQELLGLEAAWVLDIDAQLPASCAAAKAAAQLAADWPDDEEARARDELAHLQPYWLQARGWRDLAADDAAIVDPTELLQRSLGARVVVLTTAGSDGKLVAARHPQLRLSLDNARSRIAQAAAGAVVRALARWETTAVIDQSLFAALGADEMLIAACPSRAGLRVVLSAPLAGLQPQFAAVVLAATVGEWAEAADEQTQAHERLLLELGEATASAEQRHRSLVHEISSPLAIIGNYVHLLRGQQVDGASNEYLNALQDELSRIGELLQSSAPGHPAAMNLRDAHAVAGQGVAATDADQPSQSASVLLRSLQLALTALADARGVHLELFEAQDTQLPVPVLERVRQVLLNLLRNGIEAAPAQGGRVQLRSALPRYRDGRAHIVFDVEDNGFGLSDLQQQQLALPKQSSKGGAGLGLAIAHRITRDELRGALDYERVRAGALFRLWVPLPNGAVLQA